MYSEWRDAFSVHGKVEAAVGNVLVETQQATSVVHTNCNCRRTKGLFLMKLMSARRVLIFTSVLAKTFEMQSFIKTKGRVSIFVQYTINKTLQIHNNKF